MLFLAINYQSLPKLGQFTIMLSNLKILFFILLSSSGIQQGCQQSETEKTPVVTEPEKPVQTPPIELGASRFEEYVPMLKGKKTAFLVNQTSTIGDRHLVDIMLEKGVTISKIFAPEHGFRGEADAGEKVEDGKDGKTGIPLVSLYGKNRKPTKEYLAGLDYVVFDIQDVGARFYTYISSMSYVMEACAENGIKFLVLDRPNPNGNYVDGPMMDPEFSSFIGLHKVPVVHGMTVGEYAQMVNGEGWLKDGIKVDLTVVSCKYYNHSVPYTLPIKPSPNLPNNRAIHLYPSLCFFEGTTFSAGRGTDLQFQVYGHPDYDAGNYEFTPVSKSGAKYPKHENKLCKGENFTNKDQQFYYSNPGLDLKPILSAYQNFKNKEDFFLKNNFFEKLAGNKDLRAQIIAGMSEEEIKKTWANDLEAYKDMRRRYLLYPDFE